MTIQSFSINRFSDTILLGRWSPVRRGIRARSLGLRTASPKRVLIVDRQPVVRYGVRAMLCRREGCKVCGEADTREGVLRAVRLLRPQVVILGNVPQPDIRTLLLEIRGELPGVEVLVLSATSSEELVRNAVTAGARGFVLTTDPGHQFLRAIKSLVRGRPYLSRKPAEDLANAVLTGALSQAPNVSAKVKELTPREAQILQLLVNAESNKRIADFLGIGVRTVETHRAKIMRKLGLHSVVELVRYAIVHGLATIREGPS